MQTSAHSSHPGYLNKRELAAAGWPVSLVKAVLGAPDKTEVHRKGGKKWEEHLYAVARVMAVEESDARVAAAMQRRAGRSPAARLAKFAAVYGGWVKALPDAVAAMFSLNRYAKWQSCAELTRIEIYELKDRLIRLLYGRGDCTACWIHRRELPAKVCRECGGDPGDWCARCGGTGEYLPARTVRYWYFRFLVGGKTYCWHRPIESIDFSPRPTAAPEDWSERGGEDKAIALNRSRLSAARLLVSWVLDEAGGGAYESAAAEALPVREAIDAGAAVRAGYGTDAAPAVQLALF